MNIEDAPYLKEIRFLHEVQCWAKKPEMANKILQAVVVGLSEKAERNRSHAVDMETVASMALNTRLFKGNEHLIADKLEKWSSISAYRWDDQIEKLRAVAQAREKK